METGLHGSFGSRCNEDCYPVLHLINQFAQKSRFANSGRGNGTVIEVTAH